MLVYSYNSQHAEFVRGRTSEATKQDAIHEADSPLSDALRPPSRLLARGLQLPPVAVGLDSSLTIRLLLVQPAPDHGAAPPTPTKPIPEFFAFWSFIGKKFTFGP
jgi:hypothetical protein